MGNLGKCPPQVFEKNKLPVRMLKSPKKNICYILLYLARNTCITSGSWATSACDESRCGPQRPTRKATISKLLYMQEPPRTLGYFWTLESMATAVTTYSRVGLRHTRVGRTLEYAMLGQACSHHGLQSTFYLSCGGLQSTSYTVN